MIYFIQCQGTFRIKVGYTGSSAEARKKELQTGSSSSLVVIGAMPGNKDTEARVHARLASSRDRGEWFKPTPEVLRFLLEVNVMGKPDFGKVLESCLVSPNECDSNGEPANVVDGLFAIAEALHDVADVLGGGKSSRQRRREDAETIEQLTNRWLNEKGVDPSK